MKILSIHFVAIIGMASLFSPHLLHAQNPISVDIEVNSTVVNSANVIALKYTMTNTTDHVIYVLKWGTPLQGNMEKIASITSSDTQTEVKYIGPQYKRGDPTKESYVTLGANQSVTETIYLNKYWELNQAGSYLITLKGIIHDVIHHPKQPPTKRNQFEGVSLDKTSVTFKLAEPVINDKENKTLNKGRQLRNTAHFYCADCTDRQWNDISDAVNIILNKMGPIVNKFDASSKSKKNGMTV